MKGQACSGVSVAFPAAVRQPVVVHEAAPGGRKRDDRLDLAASGAGERGLEAVVAAGSGVCCDALKRYVGGGEGEGAFEDG